MGTVTANSSATTATACGCCGTLDAATLACRTRGGTATLIGFSEYADASSPPKKYRTQTLDGGWCNDDRYDVGGVPTCDGALGNHDRQTYGGTYQYDPVTGAETNSQTTSYGIQIGTTNPCASVSISPQSAPAKNLVPYTFDSSDPVVTIGKTNKTWQYANTCHDLVGITRTTVGTITADLSDEDTDGDAMDRLLAGAGGIWGGWLSPGALGCTGTPPPCCLARWEERTSDFDFVYVESEYRVTAGGLTPSTGYSARVEIYRSVFGANTYSLFQTLIVSGTTDGSGNFLEDGTVPNEEGFESYAAAAYIVIPP